MSKHHGVFTENLPSFSQMQEKLKTCRNSDLRNFRSSFGDFIHVTFISQQLVSLSFHIFICVTRIPYLV